MKILLLNDNPVVNKLVTLSAQKTSDELDVVNSMDSIQSGEYDLLVVDDGMYNEDMFSEIKSKIIFSHSLYICSRDSAVVEAFSSTLKKPFLPTDLVELFLMFSKKATTPVIEEEEEKVEELDNLNELNELEELDEFNTDEIDEELELDKDFDMGELSLDDDKLGDISDEDLELDDELLLDDDELEDLDEELLLGDEDIEDGESVLDDEEAQKVKDLLDETSDDEVSQKIPAYEPQFAANELGLPVEEIEEFIQDFINQAYEFKDELYASLQNSDLNNVKTLSHKIKGVAANLRMQEALDAISIVNSSSDNSEIEISLDTFYKVVDRLAGVSTSTSSEDDITTDLDELEEFNTEELVLDEELILDEEELELELEDELTFDEEEAESAIDKAVTEELAIEEEELTLDEEELTFDEEELELEDEVAGLDELEELNSEELDLETQIENAVEELSDEDLESELDEETMLEIVRDDMDSLDAFDSLTSNDLKLAIGEEIPEEVNTQELDTLEELSEEVTTSEETEVKANSIEALENLLVALKDKNVLASMKGTKININITIGDE